MGMMFMIRTRSRMRGLYRGEAAAAAWPAVGLHSMLHNRKSSYLWQQMSDRCSTGPGQSRGGAFYYRCPPRIHLLPMHSPRRPCALTEIKPQENGQVSAQPMARTGVRLPPTTGASAGHYSDAPSTTSTSTCRPSRITLTKARSPGFFCSIKVSISSTVRIRLPSMSDDQVRLALIDLRLLDYVRALVAIGF